MHLRHIVIVLSLLLMLAFVQLPYFITESHDALLPGVVAFRTEVADELFDLTVQVSLSRNDLRGRVELLEDLVQLYLSELLPLRYNLLLNETQQAGFEY